MAGQRNATRRARHLDVQSEVGELCFDFRSVRNREAVPAPKITWHGLCIGWRVKFKLRRDLVKSVGEVRQLHIVTYESQLTCFIPSPIHKE